MDTSLKRILYFEGKYLKRIRKHEADAMADLRQTVIKAHEAGMPKAVIAKHAGISRQTVYNILKEK